MASNKRNALYLQITCHYCIRALISGSEIQREREQSLIIPYPYLPCKFSNASAQHLSKTLRNREKQEREGWCTTELSMLPTTSFSFKPQLGPSMIWIQSSPIMKGITNFSWSFMFRWQVFSLSPCHPKRPENSMMVAVFWNWCDLKDRASPFSHPLLLSQLKRFLSWFPLVAWK